MLPSVQFTFDMCVGAYRYLKMQKIFKGWLFHARVTVDHEINLELGELSGLTRAWRFVSRQNLAWNNVHEDNPRG